jgi:hypothetical protein
MLLLALAVAFLSLALTVRPAAAADPMTGQDTYELRDELRHTDVRIDWKREMPPTSNANYNRPAKLGDVRLWVALDGVSGTPYLKEFQLRGTSKTAELWTAVDLAYPEGDCRNVAERINVTDAQVADMLLEFNHIRPIDTAWFGEPFKRTGANAELPALLGVNQNAYRDPQGRDVILVDNVIDENFEDTDNANSLPRIGGFFWPTITFYHDRNVITLDSFDWIARTGEDPVHTPSTDPCINSPARPELFEGTLAHEYQHLIHEDYDPDELNWVNEGMADFAELLTGYGDLNLHMDEMGYDTHIQGFLGWLSVAHPEWNPIPSETGPENSLTMWEDQDKPGEIFADYGFAYYFMSYLQSLGFDQSFFTAWHHNTLNGIAGLEATLAASGSSETFRTLFTDVVVSALVDGFIDNGAMVSGVSADRLQNDPTEATIFFSEDAYASPGAPVWGSDYVPLGPGAGITSLTFDGDEQVFAPGGPEWVVGGNGYWTTSDGPGNPYANDLDADITRAVTVADDGGGTGTLAFQTYYSIELGWDFGFVQVSTDGGDTFESVACTGTTTTTNPDIDPTIGSQVPGFTGPSETDATQYTGTAAAPVDVTCDLPAGDILLSFRMMTDGAAQMDGWHVRNVAINGTAVDASPEDLSDWNNQAFYQPVDVGHIFQLVGLTGTVDAYGDILTGGDVVVIRPTLGAGSTYTLTEADRAALAGSTQVVAIVSGTAPGDTGVYAPYSLIVNGEESADGAALLP